MAVGWMLILGSLATTAGMAQAAPQPKTVDELVSRLEATAASLQDYEVRGEGVADSKHDHYKLYFKRPDLVRIDAKDGEVATQPNGEIRGRLGKGPFGSISRRISRTDKRLRDSEGIPFWESHFPASVARIRSQIQNGAAATMSSGPDSYTLTIRSGDTTWRYVIDKATMFFRENSRSVGGKEVEETRYSDFRPNIGLKTGLFKF